MRCATCRKLEAYSEEAVTRVRRRDRLRALGLEVVNTDQAENKHFVKDFELVTKAWYWSSTGTARWSASRTSSRIWQLVGDKDGFIKYVQGRNTRVHRVELMDIGLWLAVGTALWLGILTSISPCPLATNIAAVSYVGRQVGSTTGRALSGGLYTAGRALAYLVLGAAAVWSLMSVVAVSSFLQGGFHRALGPLLIVVGLLLLWASSSSSCPDSASVTACRNRVDRAGIWGAGILGIVFALSFCRSLPALFFGSLVPLAAEHGSPVLLPTVYGIGTALPVAVFAVVARRRRRLARQGPRPGAGVRNLGAAGHRLGVHRRWHLRDPSFDVVFDLTDISTQHFGMWSRYTLQAPVMGDHPARWSERNPEAEMVRNVFVALTAFVLLTGVGFAAEGGTRLLRFPDIHGDRVVFSYAGDLWWPHRRRGARRLTSHPGEEFFPRFSPDGAWIAFTGQYDGDEQVYVDSRRRRRAAAADLLPGAGTAAAALGLRQPGLRVDAGRRVRCSSARCETATA